MRPSALFFFFFFNDTATTEIYTLSLHDALPISRPSEAEPQRFNYTTRIGFGLQISGRGVERSEEHTSELQSQSNLVCRLLLEKKKTQWISLLSDGNGRRSRLHPTAQRSLSVQFT